MPAPPGLSVSSTDILITLDLILLPGTGCGLPIIGGRTSAISDNVSDGSLTFPAASVATAVIRFSPAISIILG